MQEYRLVSELRPKLDKHSLANLAGTIPACTSLQTIYNYITVYNSYIKYNRFTNLFLVNYLRATISAIFQYVSWLCRLQLTHHKFLLLQLVDSFSTIMSV